MKQVWAVYLMLSHGDLPKKQNKKNKYLEK
jgi:hypothetical protein